MSRVGIKALEIHIPNQCVTQADLEKHDGIPAGKYTIGLGQTQMGFCDDREDIYSMCLTALSKLLKNYKIDTKNIGRLEVGTETLLDKSKSVKSVLMQLMGDNHDIEGVDTVNACYGGTSALFNAVNWVSSEEWDGRDAIVVCGDIALYAKGGARPTGGAGSVAMLIGRDAPIVIDSKMRATFMDHVYDFYKPDFTVEYPVVFGQYSVGCYTNASDECYNLYQKKFAQKHGVQDADKLGVDHFDYLIAHSPTAKTVQKAYARMLYNDYLQAPSNPAFESVGDAYTLAKVSHEQSLSDKQLEKTFVALSKERYAQRVAPSIQASTNIGNMYTASLYGGLISLLTNVSSADLQGKRIGAYSYGSGLASSLFSFVVQGDVSHIAEVCNLSEKLSQRAILSPVEYEACIALREKAHCNKSFEPQGSIDRLAPATYYLVKVDEHYRREYAIKA
ncbi:putative hydroxymethylglutaryl-CoA synthase Erg13 [Protomyces lactucae-debilis]|uniref:Hydroxymethylglutaryl-CoA synthase n=1 Tax=Protomyces lactucae-debilis TaxID=2754530 RepID=A0A1Y2FAX0_PROLT|nr:putative hydroxymethylglutaryl-CoA synthase Erg13 [Protomyces lactucae-debilis]ORY81031.1 putative hydroxymethylglutaryl-CoA synthase Erg13 [Protomyces lactucae-debilis]